MSAAINKPARNPVGRPRSFNEAETLSRVMEVFWRQGFDGTSMADILAATGLHKGSVYQAFGDKHSLFVRALKAYIDNMAADMKRLADQAESGIEALRAVTYYHIDHGVNADGVNTGCLALNTLVETAQDDPDVMAVLEAAYAMRGRLMGEAIARAQAEGDLRNDWSTERLVHLIATAEAGVLVELKGILNEAGAKAIMDDLFSALG